MCQGAVQERWKKKASIRTTTTGNNCLAHDFRTSAAPNISPSHAGISAFPVGFVSAEK